MDIHRLMILAVESSSSLIFGVQAEAKVPTNQERLKRNVLAASPAAPFLNLQVQPDHCNSSPFDSRL